MIMSSGGLRLGASIWGFYFGREPEDRPELDAAVRAVRAVLGIDPTLGVEVWASKAFDVPAASDVEIEVLAAFCHEAAFVTVHVRGAYWHWSPVDLRDEIDFAHCVGAETLVLHPICLGLTNPGDRIDVPEIRRIAEYAAARGVRLAVENMVDSVWALDRFLDEIGDNPVNTNLAVCIDTGHAHMSHDAGRHPVTNYLERYAAQLVHLHLHDNAGQQDEHLTPGNGTIDWPSAITTLVRIGFSGTVALENRQVGSEPAGEIKRGLEFLRSLLD
jgi:sugar phosphate isomerase/epimerase